MSKGIITSYFPFEIQDNMLLNIERPCDLAAFAATCKYWAELIMPRHIEYRVLRICKTISTPNTFYEHLEDHDWIDTTDQTLLNDVLLHLASSQLAHGIREVEVTHYNDRPDILPRSLALSVKPPEHSNRLKTIWPFLLQQALMNMKLLSKFTWRIPLSNGPRHSRHKIPGAFSHPSPRQQRAIFDVLRQSNTLVSLDVSIDSTTQDKVLDDAGFPLWRVVGLTSLNLKLVHPTGPYFITMLQYSPFLEELHTSYFSEHTVHFKSFHFPHLRILHLSHRDDSYEGNNDMLNFIYSHPDIEHLQWDTDYNFSIRLDFLPKLKTLSSNSELIVSTLQKATQCILEKIDYIELSAQILSVFRRVNVSSRLLLREIEISPHCESPDLLNELALLFPNATIINI